MPIRRLRNLCFTVNNYRPEHFSGLLRGDRFSYIIIGKEVGTSGTPHLQGYAELDAAYGFNTVRSMFPAGTHIEARRGSQAQAIEYCKKDGRFEESGEPRSQGRRNDLEDIRTMLTEGKSDLDIAMEHFGSWVRYRKSFTAFRHLLLSTEIPETRTVDFFCGATGTGKSKLAQETLPDAYWHSTGKWFQDYSGQDFVIFDDLRPGDFSIGELLRLCDPHPKPIRVEYKGGAVLWCASKIIITTNIDIDEWFTEAASQDRDAFRRRVRVKRFFINPLQQ